MEGRNLVRRQFCLRAGATVVTSLLLTAPNPQRAPLRNVLVLETNQLLCGQRCACTRTFGADTVQFPIAIPPSIYPSVLLVMNAQSPTQYMEASSKLE